ncbi:MAG TPA: pyridoxamine 5'-phosphate oxidase family protein [Spirochaeta sp.]|nr:pyridoxamine 5'-phosphate oxidase family protein [Spirochaeta sp.]
MRRDKQEITEKSVIADIIKKAGTARLGINREGAPYVVPMNFGYDEGIFYFHCAGAGLKLELLKADPRVCIELDESSSLQKGGKENPCDWGVDYRSVIASGEAVFLEDGNGKEKALNIIVSQFLDGNIPPLTEAGIRATTVFKVDPDSLTAKGSD